MSFLNKLGVVKYNVRREVTRSVITQAVGFRAKRLIVFLTPGFDTPSGGIWSISGIYRESQALHDLHGAKVAICTIPGDPPLLKYTWFKNRNYLLDLESLLSRCSQIEYLLIHIPEYAIDRFADWLESYSPKLKHVKEVHLNVLVQHIDIMREQDLSRLAPFGKVTCTTAHEAYSNADIREELGVSLHRLSCCNGPERYTLSAYADKEQLLMVGHDEHPLKEAVLDQIKKAFPALRIQVIRNLTFEQYLDVARRAKWSLTFGEGLDSYFSDTVWSGGVSFAVYNERFFTPAFAKLETVYPSWEALMERMVMDLKRIDEPVAYERCWKQAWDILNGLYSVARFRENLRAFYRGEYTFP
jgi:hypothetical protein